MKHPPSSHFRDMPYGKRAFVFTVEAMDLVAEHDGTDHRLKNMIDDLDATGHTVVLAFDTTRGRRRTQDMMAQMRANHQVNLANPDLIKNGTMSERIQYATGYITPPRTLFVATSDNLYLGENSVFSPIDALALQHFRSVTLDLLAGKNRQPYDDLREAVLDTIYSQPAC